MAGLAEGVIRRREVTWHILVPPTKPEPDKYGRPIPSAPDTIAFRCAWAPARESRGEPGDIGRLVLGDRIVGISVTSLEEDGVDRTIFVPDRVVLDEHGKEWGIRYVNDYTDRVRPSSLTDSRALVMGVGKVAIQ